MNVKQFLKPDWKKIIMFVILSIVIVVSIPVLNSCMVATKQLLDFLLIFMNK